MANDFVLNENSVLSDVKAPTINDISARRILSNEILKNVYQGIIERDGEGITQRFSRDTSGAEIRVPLQVPLKVVPRTLGSSINGGNFPTSAKETALDTIGVPVLFTIDEPIDIAQVNRDMIPVDLLALNVKSWTDQVNLQTNAMTIAGKFYATFKNKLDNVDVNVIESDETDLVYDFMLANGLLDEGAEEVGVSMFPSDDRVAVIRSAYRPVLLKKGILTLNGSDRASMSLEKGTLSATATPRKLEDGYIGTIDNVPFHIANNQVWKIASKWLGLGDKEFDSIIGYISSGLGNIRAIASPNDVQISDHPNGRGVRLKPLFRAGFKVAEGYEKGNVFITKTNFVNPYEQIIADGLTSRDIYFNAYGSRMDSNLVLATSGAKVTATFDSRTVVKCQGAKGDCQGSVAKFKALASKVQLTSGSAATITGAAANDVVSVLALCKDGTCTLQTIKVKA